MTGTRPPEVLWYDDGSGGRRRGGAPTPPRYRSLPTAARVAVCAVASACCGCSRRAPAVGDAAHVVLGAISARPPAPPAVGLILIWRANRVINFANGAMAGVAGLTAVHLFVSWGWPYWTTLLTAPLLGLVVGALVEVAIIRRFANAPRLVLTVATIGLAQLLGGIELMIPGKVFGASGMVLGAFETPLNSFETEVGAVIINGNHLLTVLVVPVVVAVLAWFLRRSLAGTAIRAASENTDRARLLGIPVRNLTTAVWAIAGGLAALTFVLQAPFQGAAPSAAAGPAILLPALAAAIVARMESLPKAFVAAVGLGVMQQVVRWNTDTPSLVDVAILIVILVALLVGERSKSRAHDADGGWRNADWSARSPPAVAALPLVKWSKRVGLVLLIAGAVLLPTQLGPSDAFSVSIRACGRSWRCRWWCSPAGRPDQPRPVRHRRRRGDRGRQPGHPLEHRPVPGPGDRHADRRPGRGAARRPGAADQGPVPGRGHPGVRGGAGRLRPQPERLPRADPPDRHPTPAVGAGRPGGRAGHAVVHPRVAGGVHPGGPQREAVPLRSSAHRGPRQPQGHRGGVGVGALGHPPGLHLLRCARRPGRGLHAAAARRPGGSYQVVQSVEVFSGATIGGLGSLGGAIGRSDCARPASTPPSAWSAPASAC